MTVSGLVLKLCIELFLANILLALLLASVSRRICRKEKRNTTLSSAFRRGDGRCCAKNKTKKRLSRGSRCGPLVCATKTRARLDSASCARACARVQNTSGCNRRRRAVPGARDQQLVSGIAHHGTCIIHLLHTETHHSCVQWTIDTDEEENRRHRRHNNNDNNNNMTAPPSTHPRVCVCSLSSVFFNYFLPVYTISLDRRI